MTIESALEAVATNGLLVNNLFQLDGGRWRCSLRDETGGYDFGDGDDPEAAINAALRAVSGGSSPFIENAAADDILKAFMEGTL